MFEIYVQNANNYYGIEINHNYMMWIFRILEANALVILFLVFLWIQNFLFFGGVDLL